jgi:YegS/Rv2252/BmrU family lipid kinase
VKTRLIVNPRSGGAARVLGPARDFAAREGAELRLTERPGHAGELAREALADGCGLVVAVGGDGTVNEVAAALAGTGRLLGLVPGGSGNGLGRALGLHLPPAAALAVLKTGRPRRIDMGLADGRPFFNVAGLGLEAELADRFNRAARRGIAGYLRVAAGSLDLLRASRFTLTIGGARSELAATTVAVANGPQYGSNALIAPRARLDDGRLDITAVPRLSALNALPLITALFRGTLASRRDVFMAAGERIIVERAAPGPLHTDGEVHPAGTRVEFTVRTGSLEVLVPG